MPITFESIRVGDAYSRNQLIQIWGYAGIEAISRGVVTPRDEAKIVLFVTEEKQAGFVPYQDELVGDTLYWEGPTDHFAEDRILAAKERGYEIHLFYRKRHHQRFTYKGVLRLVSCQPNTNTPSKFVFKLSSGSVRGGA